MESTKENAWVDGFLELSPVPDFGWYWILFPDDEPEISPGEGGKNGDEKVVEVEGPDCIGEDNCGREFIGTFFRSTLFCGIVSATRKENGSEVFEGRG